MQTLFNGRRMRKYLIVRSSSAEAIGSSVDDVDSRQRRRRDNTNDDATANDADVIEEQLCAYAAARRQLEEDKQALEATAKTDRTGWFSRTGWTEHLRKRNLIHLAYQVQLPRKDERKLQLAARLTEQLIEQCVQGLASLPRELRRWLRSAKQSEPDVRPLARLQNPESQAKYASYMVRFVCYYLRVIVDEDRERESSIALSLASGRDSNDDDDDEDRGRIALRRLAQPMQKADLMKDAREMFPWKGDQRLLAAQLWFALDRNQEGKQIEALLASLTS